MFRIRHRGGVRVRGVGAESQGYSPDRVGAAALDEREAEGNAAEVLHFRGEGTCNVGVGSRLGLGLDLHFDVLISGLQS